MKNQKIYKAWARKKGANNEYVTTEIKAESLKEAKKWFNDNGYELNSKIYLA